MFNKEIQPDNLALLPCLAFVMISTLKRGPKIPVKQSNCLMPRNQRKRTLSYSFVVEALTLKAELIFCL